MSDWKFLTKAYITNIVNHKTTAVSFIPSYSCYYLDNKSCLQHAHTHTHTYWLHCTLATCRGFCWSAPPWSLKPHGAPPERETMISSATIPAHSSQPAVCMRMYRLLYFFNSSHSVSINEWVCVWSFCLLSPLHDHSNSLHLWGARGWLTFICSHWNAVLEGGQSGGWEGAKSVCMRVCVWVWVCSSSLVFNTCHVTLKHSVEEAMLADIPSKNNHSLFDPQLNLAGQQPQLRDLCPSTHGTPNLEHRKDNIFQESQLVYCLYSWTASVASWKV